MNCGARTASVAGSDVAVPCVSVAAMREVDRVAVEELGLDLPRMMENAGRALAALARRRFLGGDVRGKRVLVLAGSGGNGGGAITAGRRLLAWGASVDLQLATSPERMTRVSRAQLELFLGFGGILAQGSCGKPDLVIDGILGYSQDGPPRGEAARFAERAAAHAAPILALDLPTGLDATTGEAFEPGVRPVASLALGLPKCGLLRAPPDRVGELWLADLSIPPGVYARWGLAPRHVFAQADLVRLNVAELA